MRGDCLEPWGSVLPRTLMLPQVKDLSVGHWMSTTSLLGMGPLSWRLSTCPAHCPLRPQMEEQGLKTRPYPKALVFHYTAFSSDVIVVAVVQLLSCV